ncbi:unnamed protein product [Adineta steineri]|uniref:Uncharacterized protein n=1 Tax=Adineta steineri TaxID=433720 RepID=A0A814P111_9BILA|nr:unnamed protein product [Adineta steineri]CAF1153115.1 unnamed protein product [Adineta steineri]
MYKHIYDLSGTLGSENEREFLKLTYKVDLITISAALPSKFKEEQPMLSQNREQWRNKILDEAIKISETRSVLIICETIKDVDQIHQIFCVLKYFDLNKLFVYKRSYEKFSVEHDDLDIGKIITATNLAGKGTDIKITNELNNNDDLHVILTYLPDSYRVEQQTFEEFINQLNNIEHTNDVIQELVVESSQLLKLAKFHIKNKNNQQAFEVLNKVIYGEPKFSHAASFNEHQLKNIFVNYQLNYDKIKNYSIKTDCINENNLKQYFEDLNIPHREHFQQLMIQQDFIIDVKDFIIVNMVETNTENYQLKEFINKLGKELKSINEIKPEKEAFIYTNKIATINNIDKLQNKPVEQFTLTTLNDFLETENLNIND